MGSALVCSDVVLRSQVKMEQEAKICVAVCVAACRILDMLRAIGIRQARSACLKLPCTAINGLR